jgi:ankyrin repeat protein
MNLKESAKVLIGLVGLVSLLAIFIFFGGSYWYAWTENRNFEQLRIKSALNCQTMSTHCAIQAKDKPLLATLLRDQGNHKLVDGWGSSALLYAVANEKPGEMEFVQMLLDAKINVHQENEQGDDALAVALRMKRLDLAELLLKNGAEPNRLVGLKGQKRLNRIGSALLNGQREIVTFLIDHGADKNRKDEFGYSYCERLKLHSLEASFPRCGE